MELFLWGREEEATLQQRVVYYGENEVVAIGGVHIGIQFFRLLFFSEIYFKRGVCV